MSTVRLANVPQCAAMCGRLLMSIFVRQIGILLLVEGCVAFEALCNWGIDQLSARN